MSSNNIMLDSKNRQLSILISGEDFESWYLGKYDMSMFDEESVMSLLEEEKPTIYPCIPVLSDDGFSISYIELSLVERWFKEIHGGQDLDLDSYYTTSEAH